ncbi:MAG: sucrose-specific PTS transporter subunit IIBC [Leuconostoc mesenteroides]|jgi:PTS system sucrose-specific IIC component|uniref:sucrose-specific PTS transporter subunit IIBC n=1 Tax=Leuconostoc mesenteroides TaxID=1245 RepID=UPI0003D7E313|nr:sucrose-specific PTS transporter subunit IIBC [Leuconostoc mesenteroides]MBC9703177.1 PTS glucose transporter subunit IIA [Leuconostoc sp.]AHF18448.1 sucrose PTS, EIIBCA [Leuconostoc mesenteroides KFRI-MG]APE76068.1 PTS beta-glucoside transporter subunit EIIBCA [Leuconostoc mesenteroides subsp. jonggajibkimchii]ASR68665.1 PTS beta-glucoside transporter subunit EIIBCA [Leuconostoc mesenteroides]AWV37192.1 PTS beta-glucoside transporter subunit EIIBCA [Leuconostoc mesenteroides]
MDHNKVAKRIADAVGKDNIVAAAHCATRLRLVIKDVKKIDQDALDNDSDLKGTFNANGQYQIIVGPGDVNGVYDEFVKITGVEQASTADLKKIAAQSGKRNPLMDLVKVLSDIFVPLIPALVAGGLLMALNNILTGEGMFGAKSLVEMFPQITGLAEMINLMASAPFAFLPILIGITATRRFGGNEILGAAAGMMLVMPSLVNGYNVAEAVATGKMPTWDLFGLSVAQAGYQGQVLPVIGVAFILANLEKFFHKHLKGAIDFTFTPMLSIILTGFITFIVVGPVLRIVSNGITDSLTWLVTTFGFIGYGVFGTFYSAIVITGLHQSFPAIETQLLADVAKTGGDFIFPIAAASNVAQGAATFAIYFLSKGDEKVRALASSSGASAMLGITEPAMFGVNLKYKFPFFIALGSAGISSLVMGLFQVMSSSLGPAGIIGFIAIPANKWVGFFIAIALSFVIAFTATLAYGRSHMPVSKSGNKPANPVVTEHEAGFEVDAPVSGHLIQLADVPDNVFSTGMMGKGVAIEPSDGTIYAPADGEITVAYQTKHAYGLTTDDGVEILIHIGLDTVNLEGQGFESFVTQGQKVKKGDKLGTFDTNTIKKAGYPVTTMVIITNTKAFNDVAVDEAFDNDIQAGHQIITAIPKTSDSAVGAPA